VPLCFPKLHVLFSASVIETLNLECAVRPQGNIDAAMPEVAVAIPINLSERTLARIALYRNVLHVPPGPSTKNTRLLLFNT
jgi:hypothetical protein